MSDFKKRLQSFLIPARKNGYEPGILRSRQLFWYGTLILLLKIAVVASFLILPHTQIFSDITSQGILKLINQARQEQNLAPLSLNNQLNAAADLKINDMLANDYFEHTSPQGLTPWYWFKQAGYTYEYAGENLAMDFLETEDVFSAWQASPTHRANILNPYFKEVGLAVKNGQLQNHNATLAVLTFGAQPAARTSLSVLTPQAPSLSPLPSATIRQTQSPKPTQTEPSLPAPASPAPEATKQPPTPTASPLPNPEASSDENNLQMLQAAQNEQGADREPESVLAQTSTAPKILGAFISHFDKMVKSLYLYFALLLLIALGVNIFVKIKIQRWNTIVATGLLIAFAILMIFI